MPELWEHCNAKSLGELLQLYCIEYGCYPDFYYVLSGEKLRPSITVSPDIEEEQLEGIKKFMSQPPSNRQDRIDD